MSPGENFGGGRLSDGKASNATADQDAHGVVFSQTHIALSKSFTTDRTELVVAP